MKKTLLTALIISFMAPSVWAVTTYNQNIVAIFGSGNPDTGWTADTAASGIQLALRGKERDTASTANASGVYSYATGFDPNNAARARWNWEFSINSDTSGALQLNAYDYYVGVDLDPSQGINYTVVNALTFWTDNSYGNNGTANGAGVEGTSGAPDNLAVANNIAQQSQNLVFAGGNPNLDATYNYELFAVASGAGAGGARLADVGITVVVGNGGAPASVPEAGSTLALLGLSVAGLAGFSFRKRKLSA